jgi:hypothetical protein
MLHRGEKEFINVLLYFYRQSVGSYGKDATFQQRPIRYSKIRLLTKDDPAHANGAAKVMEREFLSIQ